MTNPNNGVDITVETTEKMRANDRLESDATTEVSILKDNITTDHGTRNMNIIDYKNNNDDIEVDNGCGGLTPDRIDASNNKENDDGISNNNINGRSSSSSNATMSSCCCRMKGIQKDWMYHTSTYKDEWIRRPKSISKVIAATIFSFFTQLIPGLIFADLLDQTTYGSISVIETLLSAGIIGVIYSIITGQSLVLLGITGPVAILLGTSYGLAERFDNTNYYSFFFYICIWTSLLHIITAMNDTIMNFVTYITAFTSSIFEFFIGITFIYESIRDLIRPLQLLETISEVAGTEDIIQPEEKSRTAVWVSFVIGIFAFVICYTLHFAEHWIYFNYSIRHFLSSYNMVISVSIVTALSYLPGIPTSSSTSATTGIVGIDRVHITAPWDGQPSDPNRSWVVNPSDDISWTGILGALFPAVMLYLLFFIDHNISSILTQDAKFNLKKKPTYHWDMFCLGITIIPCAILALPPGSGLIPQAPLHTRALATRERREVDGVMQEVTTYVEEQRYSALGQSLLMFVALASFHVIAWIPKSALYGIFLYLGVGALYNNEIWHRFLYMFVMKENRPSLPLFISVKWSTIQLYTTIEIICAFTIFAVANFLSVGYVFPALVTALVPIRFYVLPRIFHLNDLNNLDPLVPIPDHIF